MLNFLSRDKPVTIRFMFGAQADNRKRLTWDDLETIENIQNGETSSRGLKDLAARFMADEKGAYLPHDKAVKILGGLNGDDIQSVLKQFSEAMQEAAVPKASGSDSN